MDRTLDNSPPMISTKPSTPHRMARNNSTVEEKPSLNGQSIFAAAWNLLHIGPMNLSRSLSNSNGKNENNSHETGDDPNNNQSGHYLLNDTTSVHSAGPPSRIDSFHGINLKEAVESLDRRERESLKVKTSSCILNTRLSSHSKLFIRDSKTMQKKSSEGINAILDCSSTSVGSTHRSSVLTKGPRCAYDYVKMLQDVDECKMNEFPINHFRYDMNTKDFVHHPPNNIRHNEWKTPVLKEDTKSINKSFLESVNEQIQNIKANQERERTALILGGQIGEELSGDPMMNNFFINQTPEKPITENILPTGTSKHTVIIDGNIRKKTKTETSIQTETGANSPSPWEIRSRMDSQLALLPSDQRKLGCLNFPTNPQSLLDQRQILRRTTRLNHSSSFLGLGKFLNFNDALGITGYSLQTAWNTADEMFRTYLAPQAEVEVEENENQLISNEEMQESENVVAMSVMKLLGFPTEARYAIYHEVLQEIQVIHDFSYGTVQLLSSMIDWICTGNHNGPDDLVNKTRYLATCQTEVDPASETWGQFERDIEVFSEAVSKAVGTAVRAVSRQCTESLLQGTDQSDDLTIENVEILEIPSSISDENLDSICQDKTVEPLLEDEESNCRINTNIIPGMVTDSEFELRFDTPIPRTESQASDDMSIMPRKKKSQIPIPTNNNLLSQRREDDQQRGRRNLTPGLEMFKKDKRVVICDDEQEKEQDSRYEQEGKDSREKYLSERDVELLRECRRLTALKGEECSNGMSESSSYVDTSGSVSQSCIRDFHQLRLAELDASRPDLMNSDLTTIVSAIASVASSVTSTLLNRAHSAASYIPSFNDTFGPQVDEDCRFEMGIDSPEPDDLETPQNEGTESPSMSCKQNPQNQTGQRARSSSRFLAPPHVYPLTNGSSSSSRPLSNDFDYLEPDPLSKLNGHQTYYEQVEEQNHKNDNHSKFRDNDKLIQSLHQDSTSAWELFDYINYQEAELAMTRQSESGSGHDTPSSSEREGPEVIEEESLAARLSKAALSGLYNSLMESIPSPLITINEDPSQSSSSQRHLDHPSSGQRNLTTNDNFMPGLRESRILKTPSGHSYIVNARHSSIYKDLDSSSDTPPVSSQLRVPTNSDAEFNMQLAQDRMYDDIEYLEQVLQVLKATTSASRPQPSQSKFMPNGRPSQHQQQEEQQQQNSRIPMKKSMVPPQRKPINGGKSSESFSLSSTKPVSPPCHKPFLQNNPGVNSLSKLRHDFDHSPTTATTTNSGSKPRIMHTSRQPISNRTIPVKPKLQIINAVPIPPGPIGVRQTMYSQSDCQYSSRLSKPNNNASISNYMKPSGGTGNSYREMLFKKNQPFISGGRSRTTYSESNNNNSQVKSSSVDRPKAKVSVYKYDDGTHEQFNSSSSTCSSRNPSEHPVNNHNHSTNKSVDSPDTRNPGHVLLFFPNLETPRPLSGLITPFTRLTRGVNQVFDPQFESPGTQINP